MKRKEVSTPVVIIINTYCSSTKMKQRIITFSEDIINDFSVISSLSSSDFEQLCNLSLKFMKSGVVNGKMISAFASKLDVDKKHFQKAIFALTHIIVECSKVI